jgi:serine protease Do
MPQNQTPEPGRNSVHRGSLGSPTGRGPLSARRLTLLASVAALGLAVLVSGPNAGVHFGGAPANAATTEGSTGPMSSPASFADLAAKVKPAVISVRVKIDQAGDTTGLSPGGSNNEDPFGSDSPLRRFFGDVPNLQPRHQIITGEGSGFFISPDGYAVTNDHVVDHAKSVQVTTDDGTIYSAKVIGTDPKTDLALIKVDASKEFPYVKFADQAPRIGDWVVAVGNPFGLGGTVTAGIVSARGRDIGSNPYDDYMQIDAPINKGNSGGPTFDINGNVVGVNTAIYSPSGGSVGIGFDIPASTVKPIIDQLKQTGYVTRGQIGVEVQTVTPDIADSLGMKSTHGAIVAQAQPGGPAADAGVSSGDVITAVNGAEVKDSAELARRIAMMAPGSKVELALLHNGDQKTVTLTLAKAPQQRQARADTSDRTASADVGHLGLTVAPARDDVGIGNNGVVITGVNADSPAGDHGLRPGDVIVAANGKTVSTPAELRGAVGAASAENRHSVLLQVKTQSGMRFVALPLGQA